MSKEVIIKKLEQLGILLKDLEPLLRMPKDEFENDTVVIRAAERNFQLIVEIASDINTAILIEETGKTPDTYKQSFVELEKIGAVPSEVISDLAASAKLRNILVHEYEFEEDYGRFYDSAKSMLPAYHRYAESIKKHIRG
ncbi:MAG: DUF86 domain-containing protein [Parcubacteria group bacterium]|nr:DUF86 domain-containing protein [Parcubacteria group bacterium]